MQTLLTRFNSIGSTGKFFVVEPALKHPSNIYHGRLKMCMREIVSILHQIGGIIPTTVNINDYPAENHGVFTALPQKKTEHVKSISSNAVLKLNKKTLNPKAKPN